jgi:hypothetical protein
LAKVIDDHVGPEQRERLDDHLHEKTKYLVKQGVLTFEEREVLKRMHEYRNAAYHRDTLNAGLISDLVLEYMMLASQLLARHRPMMVTISATGVTVVTPDELPCLLTDGLRDRSERSGWPIQRSRREASGRHYEGGRHSARGFVCNRRGSAGTGRADVGRPIHSSTDDSERCRSGTTSVLG